MRAAFRLVFPPLSVGSALLEATPLKPVSSCSLLISPSLPSSCLLSMASSSCPTEDNSEEVSSTGTLSHPTPPHPNSTLQTNHNTKGSQMLTWRTGTQATPAHVRGGLWAVTSERTEVKSNTEGIIQKKCLVDSKGIKHGDRHKKCRF